MNPAFQTLISIVKMPVILFVSQLVDIVLKKALVLIQDKLDKPELPEDFEMKKLTARQSKQVAQAVSLYEQFTGHEGEVITAIDKPKYPDAVAVIGLVDGIMYSTVRDGIAEKYIHEFSGKSRPLFAVSPDGKCLLLIGGSYNFTDRGIVDSRN